MPSLFRARRALLLSVVFTVAAGAAPTVPAGFAVADPASAAPRRAVAQAQPAAAVRALPATPRPADLARRLDRATAEWETLVEQYNDVREELRATQARAAELTALLDPLHRRIAQHQAQLGRLAAGAYRSGRPAELTTLLGADAAGQLARRLVLVDRLVRERQTALGELHAARARHEAARRALATLAAHQRAQQARLADRRRQVEADLNRLRQLRQRAYAAGWREPAPPRDGYVPRYSAGAAGTAVRFAYAQLGKGYRWGAGGPDAYDCSGLTSAAWRAAGVRLPHNAARQFQAVPAVSRAELRPGDLVFYYADVRHVGIFIGDGRIIHAPQYGQPVRIQQLRYAPIRGYGRPG
ncbi:MAG TPA: NlpC/P60 family protein [Pilimelia sp.]|nr:NlpC/P60 family protein [Pilimelia sp.]